MSTRVRKQIYIEARQERFLKREAKLMGISEAEFVRKAIDAARPTTPRGGGHPEAIEKVLQFARKRLAAAKRRRGKGKRVAEGGRTWTREDLYEERFARYGPRLPD